VAWSLGPDNRTLVWTGPGPAPLIPADQQNALRASVRAGGGTAATPPQQWGNQQAQNKGVPLLTGGIHPSGLDPKSFPTVRTPQSHWGKETGGERGSPDLFGTEADIQKGAKIFDTPGGRTVLNPNGVSFFIPSGGGEGDGGGGGGGGGGRPPPLAMPPVPKPQQIPFPQQAGASSLGAPNQTWDWLLEMLAGPGLLSPAMNQLGTYLAQNSTANNQGYGPMISQPNFGGLFGGPNSPSPATQMQLPSFMQGAFGNTPWQGSTLPMLPTSTQSGGLNLQGMTSGQRVNPLAVGPGIAGMPSLAGGAPNLFGSAPAGGASRK
jgi:hypothetical protein